MERLLLIILEVQLRSMVLEIELLLALPIMMVVQVIMEDM
jgi:hypothetical protein